ncbi:MAG: MOSC domain-containing protein [Ornithinimicrobium sp.]
MSPSTTPSAWVKSVNVGEGRALGEPLSGQISGIDKRAVERISVRDPGPMGIGLGSGVADDVIVERDEHGGERQAVYLVADEELTHWSREIRRDLPSGSFGENITTAGTDVDAWVTGSTVRVGEDVVLEVCGPRIPCATFAAHLGERGWVKRFAERGRPGVYCAVRSPGDIRAGDALVVSDVPDHGIDILTLFRAWRGDDRAVRTVLDAGCLPPEEHGQLERKLQRRRRHTPDGASP